MHAPTRSHARAFATLTALASIYFQGDHPLPALELQLFPLLVGPTGAGKSHLVATAATSVGAKYLRLTRGDWLVLGTDQGRPTVWQVLDQLQVHDRLCLHLDELDKFTDLQQTGWSAAIASDLWNLLDRRLNLTAYLRQLGAAVLDAPSESALAHRLRRSLWIVGSGTWQELFRRSQPGATLGFNRTSPPVDPSALSRAQFISPELLSRFNADLLFLDYPDPEETRQLLESTGLAPLARQLGTPLDPNTIDWSQGGLRQLETLATRLCLEFQQRQPNCPTPSSFPVSVPPV